MEILSISTRDRTRGRTKYGMCGIAVTKGGYLLKITKSLIEQSFDKLILK